MKTINYTIPNPEFTYKFSCPKEEILFFDIETTGLSAKSSSIYLIGVMFFNKEENSWQLTQWFADNYKSEKLIIENFLSTLENYNYLYHFNGKTFDIPYVLTKCEKHDIEISEHCQHILSDTTLAYSFDILAYIRPLKKVLNISKANQTALEQWLGIRREDEYDGGKLIKVYSEYMQCKIMKPEKADELEHLLLLHNHDDIMQMLNVCSIMSYASLADIDEFAISEISADEDNLIITFSHDIAIPKKVTIKKDYPESKSDINLSLSLNIVIDKDYVTLKIPMVYGILKRFYNNISDYYYISDADCAVHKSLISTIGNVTRKKAAASTCYTKKEGMFLPSITLCSCNNPQFYIAFRDKICFYELPANPCDNNNKFWQSFIKTQLESIF